MNRLATLFTCLATLAPAFARADSIQFGAAFACNERTSRFELSAVVEHNEQVTVVASSLSGLKQLKYGESRLRCRVGRSIVSAVVNVHRPSNGECMGAGYVSVSHVKVGTRQLSPKLATPEAFNWRCLEGAMLVKLSITQSLSGVAVERCVADDWTWDEGFKQLVCSTEHLHDGVAARVE
jgi:hypothetical protein